MPHYVAIYTLSSGREVRQRIQSASAELVRADLKARGYFPLEITPVAASGRERRLSFKPRDLARLLRQLSMQLRSGVDEVSAVAALKDSHSNPRARFFFASVHTTLTTAKTTFGDALTSFPGVLPPHLRAIIISAEGSGPEPTADALDYVRDWVLFSAKLKGTIYRATRYPAFLLCLAIGFLILFVGWFIPRFQTILASFNTTLPAFTVGVISVGNFVASTWPVLLVLAVASVGTFLAARRVEALALCLDRVLIRVPGYARVYQAIVVTQVCKNLRAIIQAGNPVIDALKLCEDMITNRAVRAEIRRTRREMTDSGATLGLALKRSGYFPPEAVSIIETGENTGALAKALDDVAQEYEEIARESVDDALAFLQPALLVFVFVILLTCMFALILPFVKIYESL